VSEGANAILSTDSNFPSQHFIIPKLIIIPNLLIIIKGVQCFSVIEDNAYWPPAQIHERSSNFIYLFIYLIWF